jgi:hypothetical protein
LIVEQHTVASTIPFGAGVVKFLQQWLQEIEILEGSEILLGELRLCIAELFVQRWLLLLLSFVFWRRNGDSNAPSTWVGSEFAASHHDSCQLDRQIFDWLIAQMSCQT